MKNAFFITGTGTDIGKTYVTAQLAKYTTGRNLSTAVMKPAQTGMLDPMLGDLGKIKQAAPEIMDIPMNLACPYCLEFESSPHLAAALAGTEIDIRKIAKAFHQIMRQFAPDVLFLESAGGVCVPLARNTVMLDIPLLLALPTIVVADAELGTINHTVLTVNELRRQRVNVLGVIVNRVPENPGILIRDNLKMIEHFARVKILAQVAENGELCNSGLENFF